MASRKSAAAAALGSSDVVALEAAAIAAVKAIDSGYAAASKAIMAYVIGAKHAGVTPKVFEAGMARISDAIPGVAKITVGAYVSNARRIFATDKVALAKAVESAGTDSIKALAAACPAVSRAKADGQKARAAAAAAAAPTEPSAPIVKSADTDPVIAIANALVMLRKANANKRAVMSLIGEMEDMLDDLKKLAKVA